MNNNDLLRAFAYLSVLIQFSCFEVSAADWVESWLDNAVSTGPSSFESQKRGFYSMGSFYGRVNTSVDHPISVQLPKLSSGCGGVNLFYGGVSFLDEEFLVQKMENAMQAAPAIAFDIAIKTVTKEFSESLAKFEQISNKLNSLQLDDCAIAKSAVTTVVDGRYSDIGSDVWSTITNEQSLESSTSKNYHDSQDKIATANGQPTENLSGQWEGCQADFKDLFATSGSLIDRATAKFGMATYSDLVRGYIGDITVDISSAGQLPIGRESLPCESNTDARMEDFVYGLAQGRNSAGVCSNYLNNGIKEQVEQNLQKIADSIAGKTAIDADTTAWINAASLPVYRIMYRAVVDGTVDATISEVSEVLAYSYADAIFDDLYRNTRTLFRKVNKVFQESGQAGDFSKKCNKSMFVSIAPALPRLEERLSNVQSRMRQGYLAKLQEYMRVAQFVDRNRQMDVERVNKGAQETLGIGSSAQ